MKKTQLKNRFVMVVLFLFSTIIMGHSLISCKEKEEDKSSAKDILSFVLNEQTNAAQIDNENKTISITVNLNANLAALCPEIEVSEKATILPASGDTVDFSVSPVAYTVTAEDNSTQVWNVYVTKTNEMAKEILSFIIAEQSGKAIIDTLNDSVLVKVIATADLTKLKPVITTSEGTTISPASGAEVDFSAGPVVYTVSATDGTQKEWTVKVTRLLNSDKFILTASITNQIGASISRSNRLCVITMPVGSDLSSLTPIFSVSPGAAINPPSGQSADFRQASVVYTITAEDGTIATWNVLVTYPLLEADNSNIKYVGRIDMTNLKAPKYYNPGVYIKAKFSGTFCDIDIEDENEMNYIIAKIDNLDPIRLLINTGRKTYRLASGLAAGDHDILICKETEAGVGSLTFYGFRCNNLSAVTDMPTRKIEFYGNSITCGAKMLFGTPCDLTNDDVNWNAANSAYLSYGAVTARALNAQWQITAVSGIGLISSCCGMGNTMPTTYDRLNLNSGSIIWDFTKYIPDVVTISLGQNDGSSVVASQTFKNTYITFINTIRSKYPDASIFLLTSPMADSSSSATCLFTVMKNTLTEIVDSVNNAGDTKVYWVTLPHDQNHGCTGQGHPSEEEHAQTAAVLEAAIRDKMGW